MSNPRAVIRAVASFVPDTILTNAELEKMVATSDEWIFERCGIKERRIAPDDKPTSWMATEVARQLLQKSSLHPNDVDGLIVATVTPDMFFPNTANVIAGNLGLAKSWCFDLISACSGFVYALSQATAMIESGRYKNIFVVGADKMSSITDYTDRTTCILFGDAAAGVWISASEEHEKFGIHDFLLGWTKDEYDSLHMKGGGSLHPPSLDTVNNKQHYLYQSGQIVFKAAIKYFTRASKQIMERNCISPEDLDWFVPHQANKRIIEYAINEIGISPKKVCINIHKYGNTTAATIPLCLSEYESQIKKGDKVVMSAFGAGFTYAAAYLTWAY